MITVSAIFHDARHARDAARALNAAGFSRQRINLIGAARSGSDGALRADRDIDRESSGDAGLSRTEGIPPGTLAVGIASPGSGLGGGSGVGVAGATPAAVRALDPALRSVDADNAADLQGRSDVNDTYWDDYDLGDVGRGQVELQYQALDMDESHRANEILARFNPARVEETQ